nr:MAG TPA: hypothetical protein [Caudoviricetes sp.]
MFSLLCFLFLSFFQLSLTYEPIIIYCTRYINGQNR